VRRRSPGDSGIGAIERSRLVRSPVHDVDVATSDWWTPNPTDPGTIGPEVDSPRIDVGAGMAKSDVTP
jgi:hypothetical protein